MGKNCYESLCGFLLVDCCLFVPGRARGRQKEEERQQEVRSIFTGDAAATVGSGRLQAHGPGNGSSKADRLHQAENSRLLAMHEPQGAEGYYVQSAGSRGTNRIGRRGPSEILKRG